MQVVNDVYFARALAWSVRSDYGFIKWLVDTRGFPVDAIDNPLAKVLFVAARSTYAKLAPKGIVPSVDDLVVELAARNDEKIATGWAHKITTMTKPSTGQEREVANAIVENYHRLHVLDQVERWLERVRVEGDSIYSEFAALSDDIIKELIGGADNGRPRDILEEAWNSRAKEPESTGYPRLDTPLDGGWIPERLYVWGMPSGHGKSSMVCNFASRRAEMKLPTLINSFEMPSADLLFRMVADLATVSIAVAENPSGASQNIDEYNRVMGAKDLLDNWVRVYDTQATEVEIEKRIRRHQAEFPGMRILTAVDHLGIIERGRFGNDWSELEAMAVSLANIGKRQSVPILALSQVPGEVEKEMINQNMVVYNRDFRGSRGLRNAADIGVMGCKHNGLIKTDGDVRYDMAYRDHTVIQVFKNRKTGKQFWGVFKYDPMHYRLLNDKNPGTAEDIYA